MEQLEPLHKVGDEPKVMHVQQTLMIIHQLRHGSLQLLSYETYVRFTTLLPGEGSRDKEAQLGKVSFQLCYAGVEPLV